MSLADDICEATETVGPMTAPQFAEILCIDKRDMGKHLSRLYRDKRLDRKRFGQSNSTYYFKPGADLSGVDKPVNGMSEKLAEVYTLLEEHGPLFTSEIAEYLGLAGTSVIIARTRRMRNYLDKVVMAAPGKGGKYVLWWIKPSEEEREAVEAAIAAKVDAFKKKHPSVNEATEDWAKARGLNEEEAKLLRGMKWTLTMDEKGPAECARPSPGPLSFTSIALILHAEGIDTISPSSVKDIHSGALRKLRKEYPELAEHFGEVVDDEG